MRDIRLSWWGAALLVLAQGVPLADAAETRARARERPARATAVENSGLNAIVYDTGVNAGFPPDVGLTDWSAWTQTERRWPIGSTASGACTPWET